MSNCCEFPPVPDTWTGRGTLRLRTFEAQSTQPVPNVHATVRAVASGVVVYTTDTVTDEDGLYGPLTLACPPRALSLEEDPDALPYAPYEILVQHPGYDPLTVTGIMLFDGEETLAELALLPAEETADGTTARAETSHLVTIPTHPLFAGGGGSGPKPFPSVVLTRVVIPEKITVHLGKPAAAATNVTVPFRDYIKNVASSEIYPTWPEQALRANIHAQISLALNRVFTEWYPSKGYPFNITNSTSYDQYYVHGRDIFSSVSVIVDDIFNTYVRKTGTIEPYYTEYCDGKSVTCPGMKQWGTVTLANQGRNALQILQYYYGNDIEIVRTDNIAAIPSSYPGAPLRVGDTGTNVRIIQRQLNRIAKDYPSFGKLDVNGVFDSATEASVKKFQKQFSLTQDGVIGRSTWYKISYIYVSVKDLAELTSEGEKPTGEPVDGVYPGSPLRRGSTGDAVTQVQFWLNEVGQYTTSIPSLTVDGSYGAATESAVKAFQEQQGLSVDGIVGPGTWAALYDAFGSLEDDVAEGVGVYPGTPLRSGSTGDAVKRVQFFLRVISRSNSAVPSVVIDGSYGSGTAAAVTAFQTAYGLTQDGVVGENTWNRLYEVYTGLLNGLLSGSERPGTYPGTPLRAGSSGQRVKEMQYYLYLLSAYYSEIPRIAYDGIFGSATTAAVRAFQALFGLVADGIVGQSTWTTLYNQFSRLRSTDGPVQALQSYPYPGEPLRQGSTGANVRTVQLLLNYAGFWFADILPVDIDGVYGESTADAVASFQPLMGLATTGAVDEATWSALTDTYAALAAGTQNANDDGSYPGFVLVQGSAGEAVRQLQGYIDTIATRHPDGEHLLQNGIFGADTRAAVEQYQAQFGLPVTGAADRETWELIRALSETEAYYGKGIGL